MAMTMTMVPSSGCGNKDKTVAAAAAAGSTNKLTATIAPTVICRDQQEAGEDDKQIIGMMNSHLDTMAATKNAIPLLAHDEQPLMIPYKHRVRSTWKHSITKFDNPHRIQCKPEFVHISDDDEEEEGKSDTEDGQPLDKSLKISTTDCGNFGDVATAKPDQLQILQFIPFLQQMQLLSSKRKHHSQSPPESDEDELESSSCHHSSDVSEQDYILIKQGEGHAEEGPEEKMSVSHPEEDDSRDRPILYDHGRDYDSYCGGNVIVYRYLDTIEEESEDQLDWDQSSSASSRDSQPFGNCDLSL